MMTALLVTPVVPSVAMAAEPSTLAQVSATNAMPAAGVVPAGLEIALTGNPVDAEFLYAQLREAIERRVRPTLRPGASVTVGMTNPSPLPVITPGIRTAINVAVAISADASSTPVSGTTTVTVDGLDVPPPKPSVLVLSDDPEYLLTEGLVARATVTPARPTRLYYYHSDIGVPRDLDVVLTADAPARVALVQAKGGPEQDVADAGHVVSRDLLANEKRGLGTVVDLVPGTPFVLRHELLIQGEVVAGAVDMTVLTGMAVTASVVASPAGGRPDAYLAGPRLALDGHNRHGTFALDTFGDLAATYTAGGPDTALRYGGRAPTAPNVDPNDPGRDYGDYGVVHRLSFTFVNPTPDPHDVHFYLKPLGGPVRSTFVVDGELKEIGCVRLPQPYWLQTYRLPPNSTTASKVITMTDGGSYYPVEFGVTETLPITYTPPRNAPDGCSPDATAAHAPFPQPQPATARVVPHP